MPGILLLNISVMAILAGCSFRLTLTVYFKPEISSHADCIESHTTSLGLLRNKKVENLQGSKQSLPHQTKVELLSVM